MSDIERGREALLRVSTENAAPITQGLRVGVAIGSGLIAFAEAATRIADAFEAANRRNAERDLDEARRRARS